MKQEKIILIGLDGATWNLIKPWADNNKLPTFKKLMKNGTWGYLKSTIPPVTFPAWESIFTGLNPGKLGVFDFSYVDIKNQSFGVNTPSSFKGRVLWDILNEHGYKTCMVNIPTSKVRPIKGVMIGGAFSEGNQLYPSKIKTYLKEIDYEYYPLSLTKAFMESSKKEPSIDHIKKIIYSRFNVAEKLIDEEKPDFLAFVIFIIDNIQHFYWKSPLVYQSWKIIDERLEKFISKFKDYTIIIVSDHGFSKLDKTFYISKYLEEQNLIFYKKVKSFSLFNKINQNILIKLIHFMRLEKILTRIFSQEKLQSVLSFFPSKSGRIGSKRLEQIVDWEKTKCIPMSSSIYLNCRNNERTELQNMLKNELEELKDIVKEVHLKETVYSGNYIEKAPDLIIEPKKGIRVVETPFSNEIVINKSKKSWRGMHSMDGIYLFYGPRINKIAVDKANIYDITPTILTLFGLKPEVDMDGRVLNEVIKNVRIKTNDEIEKLKIRRTVKELSNKI